MRVLFLFVKGLFARDVVIIELGFGYIFYKYGVVDKNSYSMYKKMGGAML